MKRLLWKIWKICLYVWGTDGKNRFSTEWMLGLCVLSMGLLILASSLGRLKISPLFNYVAFMTIVIIVFILKRKRFDAFSHLSGFEIWGSVHWMFFELLTISEGLRILFNTHNIFATVLIVFSSACLSLLNPIISIVTSSFCGMFAWQWNFLLSVFVFAVFPTVYSLIRFYLTNYLKGDLSDE